MSIETKKLGLWGLVILADIFATTSNLKKSLNFKSSNISGLLKCFKFSELFGEKDKIPLKIYTNNYDGKF